MPENDEIILIDDSSLEPKYKQIINSVIRCIKSGTLQPGARLPSLNEVSEMHYLARDTVQHAYMELRERGIIESVPGKGFYIKAKYVDAPVRILLIFNKLTAYKKTIFNAFTRAMSIKAIVDLQVHHYDERIFENIIDSNLGLYHYYAIMPFFYEYNDRIRQIFSRIPKDKLILINKDLDFINPSSPVVYEDFERDIYDILTEYRQEFSKFQRRFLVFPDDPMSNREIIRGFRQFAREQQLPASVMTGIYDLDLQAGDVYIVIDDDDLAALIKSCRRHGFVPGADIGIISYNDTVLKEVLEDGITVISTDFEKMGETAAEMILGHRKGKVRNPFRMIRRKSF